MTIELELIKDVDKLIPRPEVSIEVMTLANQSDCDIGLLSKTINQDPSLMANMLRMANSAYFGHMQQIKSLRDIIVRLGLDSVRIIAITSASAGLLKSPQEAYNLEPGALWRHSYATALLAGIIGRAAKLRETSSLFSAALLHDVGKIILNRHLQAEAMHRGDAVQAQSLLELESSLLHTDHAKVGKALLERWGLPPGITGPVGSHHQLAACQNQPAQIVYLANYLTASIGISSQDADNYFCQVKDWYETNPDLPDIPAFREQMDSIITQFYEQLNETTTLEFS